MSHLTKMSHLTNKWARLLPVLALTLGFGSQAFAQASDIEPNSACVAAQDIGAVVEPFFVTGSLDTPPSEPDIDFFRFSLAPGTQLVADLEGQSTNAGTLFNPFLGLFDSACNLLDSNDNFDSLNSQIAFTVPANGTIILAATSCCDFSFSGVGGSSGTYRLTISPPPPSIGSIAGRVVDAVTGEPLAGNSPPFAFVDLLRCDAGNCFDFVASQPANGEGRFFFDRDFSNRALPVGTYLLRARANEFQTAETGPFDVGDGEDRDVGDVALTPPPIRFSDVQPCDALLPQGGTCRYSARINNNTIAPFRGMAWSLVDGFGLGSFLGFTTFEASTRPGSTKVQRPRVFVPPLSSTEVQFQFETSSFTRVGATFCTRLFLGFSPDPLVNTAREGQLFCITKGIFGFRVMSEAESQKIFQSIRGNPHGVHSTPAQKQ